MSSTAASLELTGPSYSPRERVHDTYDPDGVLVVLETTSRPAAAYELTDGVTVADIHPAHPETDRVAVCAYERQLDRHWPDWREIPPTTLASWPDELTVEAHPTSKLERYDAGNWTVTPEGTVCEHCQQTLTSPAAWVEHVVRECRGI